MSPYFNVETGALNDPDHIYTDSPDVANTPSPGTTPNVPRLETAPAHVIVSDPLAATAELKKMLDDKTHPLHDQGHPAYEHAVKRYLEFVMLERGLNPLDPEQNPVLGEVFANGQIRPLEAEAPGMELATRPEAPGGRQWDPIAHDGLGALSKDTPLLAQAVDAGYPVVVEAQRLADAKVRHSDRTYAQLLAAAWPNPATHDVHLDHAEYVLDVLAADDESWTQALAARLDELWEWDPRVPIFLAERVYPVLRDAAVGPLVGEMLMRAGAKWSAREAEGRARAAKVAAAQAAEDDEARAASMTATADAHDRWGRNR